MTRTHILWFRHGLRFHDNPALQDAIHLQNRGEQNNEETVGLLPIFIFDGETAGTSLVGYNRMTFLLQSLTDLDEQLQQHGGKILLFKGEPVHIFRRLHEVLKISMISFEQDCEPIWKSRDERVRTVCGEMGVKYNERVSHTLWTPRDVIHANGGIPPLTYEMFLAVTDFLGEPPRPVGDADWSKVHFPVIPPKLAAELNLLSAIPTAEDFGIFPEPERALCHLEWIGGETQALKKLKDRLEIEAGAFESGYYLPNHAFPDLLGPPSSLSAYLRFGCLSVRRFYWEIHDLYHGSNNINPDKDEAPHITGQLIWREYFYTMSVDNPKYGEMKDNPICLNIPWIKDPDMHIIEAWKQGKTGFPLLDAAMRQLLAEGWLHHMLRNTVAGFLTRGALWINWEVGLRHFLKHLLDADWSVCAGNWMWVSSSAFEKLLDTSKSCCPVGMAHRLDPHGEYVKRYIPEIRDIPREYIHQPWTMPIEIQQNIGCVIGINYPLPIVNLQEASEFNTSAMQNLRSALVAKGAPETGPPHCRPSNNAEILSFFGVPNVDAI
ncbi:Cryptochrome-1 [Sergentomyia squamirostris]